MNKAIQKLMMALAVCGVLCGTAVAAPKGNHPHGGKAPTSMRAPAPKGRTVKAPAPARQTTKHHVAPARHTPKREIVHRAPPPPERHHAPKHHHRHHHRHNNTLHTEDWCEIGASLLGGLVGGLIGAST